MYAFTPSLISAWQQLFQHLHAHIFEYAGTPFEIQFEDSSEKLTHSNLLIGHTCGYPYVSRWHQNHDTVCVPEFDIDGCQGAFYSSWIISQAHNNKSRLADFKDTVAAINNPDSNSGMNVLRYEISKVAHGNRFFSRIIMSDSHLNSMNKIITGEAEIAAIDAVTWDFAKRENLYDFSKIKIIQQTIKTPGLPFIKLKDCEIDPTLITDSLNRCLDELSEDSRAFLKIKKFTPMNETDYQPILDIEKSAAENNYPELI